MGPAEGAMEPAEGAIAPIASSLATGPGERERRRNTFPADLFGLGDKHFPNT